MMLTYSKLLEKHHDLVEQFTVSPEMRYSEYDACLKHIQNTTCTLSTSTEPIFVFATGPSGSGKSALEQIIKNDFKQPFLILDIDFFRRYHPDFKEIKKYPTLEAILTYIFSKHILNDMLQYALKKGYNIIWSASINSKEKFTKIMKNIPSYYKVGIYVMATNTMISRISAEERYEAEIQNPDCILRFPDENYMKKCDNYSVAIKDIEEDVFCKYSFIKVYKRGLTKEAMPIQVYDSTKDTYSSASKEIEIIENDVDYYYLIKRCYSLLGQRLNRNASSDEIESILRLFNRILKLL